MAKNEDEAPINFDDLLSGAHSEDSASESENLGDVAVENPDADLQAKLDAQAAEIEALKAALATQAKEDISSDPIEYSRPAVSSALGDYVTIHFREDGFSAWGQVWHRGQEITIQEGSPDWERTRDRTGFTWLDIRDDEAAQEQKYGKRYFASGPFVPRKGEKFEDFLVQEDARRGGRIPRVMPTN